MTVITLVSYLTFQGCSLAGSAGIVANLEFESGLNPAKVSISGAGLPQWAGVRRIRMIAALGPSWWSNGYRQVDYLLAELRAFGLWDAVCGEVDPSRAASVFMLKDERPRNRNPAARERRAREMYEELK